MNGRIVGLVCLIALMGCGGDEPGTGVMPTQPGPAGMSALPGAAGMSSTLAGRAAAGMGAAGRSTTPMTAAGRGASGMGASGSGAAGMTMATAGMTSMAGSGGAAGMAMSMAGSGGAAGMAMAGAGGASGGSAMPGKGMCCKDGNCLCHGPDPMGLTSSKGPYNTKSYTVGAGCIFYPTDAEPPFAAVAVSDGFLGAGGCSSFQTGQWGPFYASHGIVAMIVNTGSSDQPNQRARALASGISAFKSENMKSGSPLMGKLAGRYGTSGFSMGGGGTTYAARDDKTLLSDVAIMPWGPVNSGVTVPTLVICGSSDGTAPCASHGTPAYNGISNDVPKMRIQISSGHAGQPSSGGGMSGKVGLAFQKVFLEGDERWRPLLVGAMSVATNIK